MHEKADYSMLNKLADDFEMDASKADDQALLEYVSNIVALYVKNHQVPVAELPALIATVHDGLRAAQGIGPAVPATTKPKPAVGVRRSVTDDTLVCLECGGHFKSLKRHILTRYGMTPRDYREKWSLPPDYPMVSPNYAVARSDLAKKMRLGHTTGPRRKKEEPPES